MDMVLTYTVPNAWTAVPAIGDIVTVPVRARVERAVVVACHTVFHETSYAIRDAIALDTLANDPLWRSFIAKLATYAGVDPFMFMRRLYASQGAAAAAQDDVVNAVQDTVVQGAVQLTDAQRAIVDTVCAALAHAQFQPFLLHGVTGSGKSEIYRAAIEHVILHEKRSALYLLPDATLALAAAHWMRQALPQVTVHECHARAVGKRARRALWKDLAAGVPVVVVGVHIPVLLPVQNVGLLIVDEEHDPGYQEKQHPRINTKDAALLRAKVYNIPILLGSATPSIASLYQARRGAWKLLSMPDRYRGEFPSIAHVRMNVLQRATHAADSFWITPQLRSQMSACLARGEQVILFLNRRGLNRFVQCSKCSYRYMCAHCAVCLTLHEGDSLECHYCGYALQVPKSCPSCGASQDALLKRGIGTQRLVALVQELFPQARVARADLDSMRSPVRWKKILADMFEGSIDILVGTQAVTKGYHFPRVTLVGIIWAESALAVPFYGAAEQTVQQLIQVAGRAGRSDRPGTVVVQSFIEHPLFQFLTESSYEKFYEYELQQRSLLQYPPFTRMSELMLTSHDEQILERESSAVATHLRSESARLKWDVRILGPAMPPVACIQGVHMRKMYIKGMRIEWHQALYESLKKKQYAVRIFFTPNPHS